MGQALSLTILTPPLTMILTTADFVPGREIVKVLGFISGNSVQSSGLEKEGMAILKGFRMKGGKVQELAKSTSQLREEALRRMSGKAAQLGPMPSLASPFN